MSTPSLGFIEQRNWETFLDDFTKRNQFRATRLEVVGKEVGVQKEEEWLPLVGLTFEAKGTESGSVLVMLGGETVKDQRHVEHLIEHVERITPIPGESQFEAGLGFEDREGSKTLLLFEKLHELTQ